MNDLLIVSGASRGIGRFILEDNLKLYKNIIALGSSKKILELKKISNKIKIIRIDIINFKKTKNILVKELNKINSLKTISIVLCASRLGSKTNFFKSNLSEWSKLYSINLLGNINLILSLKKFLKKKTKLKIIFFSGGGAASAYPDFFGYSLTKASVARAVENISEELKTQINHFSIIAFAPGNVKTRMYEKLLKYKAKLGAKTDFKEISLFVRKFFSNQKNSKILSGRLIHVRDQLNYEQLKQNNNKFKIRRIQ